MTMNRAFFISQHVIDTINSLPVEERVSISSALIGEFILGESPKNHLSPVEDMLYSIIKRYVEQDTFKKLQMRG